MKLNVKTLILLVILFTGIKIICAGTENYHITDQVTIAEVSIPDTVQVGPGSPNIIHQNQMAEGTLHSPPENQEHNDGHTENMIPLLFIIIALIIGAGTRHWLRKSPLPYTVTLLVIGLLLGAMNRLGWFGLISVGNLQLNISFLGNSLDWAGHIDPHIILFVFLPTLIFEAAFAMDLHTFKKTSANAFMLAVPGIIIALLLTGTFVMFIRYTGFGFSGWSWPLALLFGTVVSATDPVAVVSLLKDLGASKKLGTLIEGESLLNDGTAIVLFMVFLAVVTGTGSDTPAVLQFLKVALGGTAIGLFFGYITISWVKKVFNDAMIEITVIIAAAYLTFFVAEHFFHVSGVLGVVTLGLVMAGMGRTRISPEVEHFLHEFWELAAFIANTLIFIIVGVIIANQAKITLNNIILLVLIYIAIHVVRAFVIMLLFPLMRKAGYGLSRRNSIVVWWGALRGAIALALALIVAGEESIPQELRDQFLFLTAGIVTLTLLVNATTIKPLLNRLGLTRVAPAKALMMSSANRFLRQSTETALIKSKKDRFLNRANWNMVAEYLPDQIPAENNSSVKIETAIAETRMRVLEKEKSSYWGQFKEGMLGPVAVRKLTEAINEIIDEGGLISLSQRKDLEHEWKTPRLLSRLQYMPVIGSPARKFFLDRLAISYDAARGFVLAQEECLKLLENMVISNEGDSSELSQEEIEMLESEINENRIHGLTFLRNLRNSYPEIYSAVTTRYAIRTVLNHEKRTIEKLLNRGRLDSGEAEKMISKVEARMKKLVDSPPSLEIPIPSDLLREIPWMNRLNRRTYSRVENAMQNRMFTIGEILVKENSTDDGLFVIIHGQVSVNIGNEKVDLLGPGSVIGEMLILSGLPRTATVIAETPLTTLFITAARMRQIMKESDLLTEELWKFAYLRFAENILSKQEPFNEWHKRELRQWLENGVIVKPDSGGNINLEGRIGILLSGEAVADDGTRLTFPALLMAGKKYKFKPDTRVFVRETHTMLND
ncbi:MAG: cation:proton antiporter [Bacteroidales bacterium]